MKKPLFWKSRRGEIDFFGAGRYHIPSFFEKSEDICFTIFFIR